MSQPQPCAHLFTLSLICERCGQPAERIADMPEAFGVCWRSISSEFSLQRIGAVRLRVESRQPFQLLGAFVVPEGGA
jgi:hypothetical protein